MGFTQKYESLIKGLILSGTGTSVGEEVSGFLKFIAKVMSKIAPKLKIKTGLDPESLSHDPEVVKAYIDDPLVNYELITAGLAYEMLKVFSNAKNIVAEIKLPLLVQCGSEDKALTGRGELKEAFTMKDKTIHIYEGLYHEVYNEVEKDRKKVLKDLSDWLEKHV